MVKVSRVASNNDSANKKKKNKKKINPNAIAMKVKAPAAKPNPFETIWSRRKFDILGKKRKGEERRIGLARTLAIEKRKKTLLKDYEQSGKSSVFVDKRIGEQNEELGEFDKAILRSQREMRVKLSKKSKYNLSDGEEDEFDIEDGSLYPERDDFEDEVPFDEEEDGEVTEAEKRSVILKQLSAHGTPGAHATGIEGEENRQKTKKEVYDEIISKSKFFKAEKAKDKEENDLLIKKLDEQFTSVQSSLAQPNQINVVKDVTSKSINHVISSKVEPDQEKADAYDKLLNEMVLDMRARPSNRTKTPEELAQDEKERLEQLEEERQKRMHAADDTSDEDNDDDQGNSASKKLTSISGDDLGDSFAIDEPKTKLAWIEQMLRKENEIDVDSDDGESSDDGDDDDGEEEDDDEEGDDLASDMPQSLKDWEQSDDDDDDDDDTDLEEKAGEDDGVNLEVKPRDHKQAVNTNEHVDNLDAEKKVAKVKLPGPLQGDLPYTIEAPKTMDDLSSLLENRSDSEIIEAIRRIRAFNAIKVAAENRKKIQVFYGLLLQYFSVSANKKPLNFRLLNLLVKPLMEMSIEIPYFAAICARQRLLRTRSLFAEDIKNSEKSCWPSMKTLFLLRLWSMIFPCSDFRHVVMTPAILLMCEYLTRCPIISGRDVAIGSFLCSMVLSVCKQSRKFCPEALVFLRTLLVAALDKKSEPSQDSELYHLMELKAPKPLLHIHGAVDEMKPLDFLTLMDLPDDCLYFSSENFRASMLVTVVDTLQGYANIYEEFKSFPEIFLPISNLLVELTAQDHMPVALKDKLRATAQQIEKKADEHHILRRPLQMRKQKPVPIKLLNPKFEENFVSNRDYDPDRQRAEDRKLRKLVKREAKGAARELRKDNYFLAEAKARDKARLEEEKAEEYGRARAFLQEQEHAFKSGQLGKNKKRRK
ncbi:nucleolar protein 14 isoform X1 [Cynara cardunculus var. scolymus]|uniref:nucleolar protein 14 isoform X1 n=1 Tax=Cynara cardunculus var. scolymus TaxID=59895 RepID=UPI000D624FCC|nr:nucleolar protein 14 isoform X1 [Cynara cardunculus var. scolymus]